MMNAIRVCTCKAFEGRYFAKANPAVSAGPAAVQFWPLGGGFAARSLFGQRTDSAILQFT